MAGVFISGFSGTSSGGSPGTHKMASNKKIKGKVKPTKKFTWTDAKKACAYIQAALKKKPCQPVVIVGHSLGGDAAIDVANCLKKKGICVDLLIQIDSVGIGDEVKPSNVRTGVNIWSSSRKGINGAKFVKGSINIPVAGTDHTSIDEKGDKGKVKKGKYAGLNGWKLVKKFVSKLKKPYCNCPKNKTAMHAKESALHEELKAHILAAVSAADGEPISIESLQNNVGVEAQYMVLGLRELLERKIIKKEIGPRKLQYFSMSQDRKNKVDS